MILVTGATGTVGLPDGIDVVRADLGDPASLPAALSGVDQVFLLSTGPEIPQYDRNVALAAVRAGVTRIVKLSVARAAEATTSDPLARWHRAGEHAVRASGLGWTFLRSVGFMSNALHWAASIRAEHTVYAPFGNARNAVIDPRDIAAVAAAVLTTPGHEHQAYRLTGPQALSPAEQTGILAEVADGIMAVRAAGLDDSLSLVYPTVEKITGYPARGFRDWAQYHHADFTGIGSPDR